MKALVRRPSSRLAEGIVTHIDRVPVDVDLAVRQWEQYVRVLCEAGWEIIEVPEALDCPDSAFIEDTMVAFRNVAVIARPGADSRKPEILEVEKVVESIGCSINRIRAPGTLDGGDVLKVGDTVAGHPRTDRRHGRRGPAHQGIAPQANNRRPLPDGTIVGWRPVVDDESVFPRFIAAPEESGAHVVLLGNDRLLMAADCPRSAALYVELGYEPVTVDISEYVKLEGCVTCLSVRLRGLHG